MKYCLIKSKFCYTYAGIFEAGDWEVGGSAESLHIMSWKTTSNSDRQEKGNGQHGCGNAGDVTYERHRKERGRTAGGKEGRQ